MVAIFYSPRTERTHCNINGGIMSDPVSGNSRGLCILGEQENASVNG